jgi:hypothetical protein
MLITPKFSSADFIFDLIKFHLPHSDEPDTSDSPLKGREFILALVLVTILLFLVVEGFHIIVTLIDQ